MSQPQPIDPRFAPKLPKQRRKGRPVVRVIGLLVLIIVLWMVAVPLYAWNKIAKVDAMPDGDRPAESPGTTFLLVGSDSREGLSKEERKKLATGSVKGQRTDTIMVLHVPNSGPAALVSLPRDSYVPIPGHNKNKINAAYSFGGAKLLTETVEQATGLRMDAYVEVGFGGFVKIIDSVGGIEMCVPREIHDKDAGLDLDKGCQQLDGPKALGYVRYRKSDPKGDLGRVERQREMIAAVAGKALSPATFANPNRYRKVLSSGAEAVLIDEDTGPLDLWKFARGMRDVAGGDGATLTVPIATDNLSTPAGSAVKWDSDKAKALFRALRDDRTTGLPT
jgi:LCP family protein required for cell wall assembly